MMNAVFSALAFTLILGQESLALNSVHQISDTDVFPCSAPGLTPEQLRNCAEAEAVSGYVLATGAYNQATEKYSGSNERSGLALGRRLAQSGDQGEDFQPSALAQFLSHHYSIFGGGDNNNNNNGGGGDNHGSDAGSHHGGDHGDGGDHSGQGRDGFSDGGDSGSHNGADGHPGSHGGDGGDGQNGQGDFFSGGLNTDDDTNGSNGSQDVFHEEDFGNNGSNGNGDNDQGYNDGYGSTPDDSFGGPPQDSEDSFMPPEDTSETFSTDGGIGGETFVPPPPPPPPPLPTIGSIFEDMDGSGSDGYGAEGPVDGDIAAATGDGMGLPPATPVSAGGPPRSGNGKPFEQCPSAGKWNIAEWNLEELIGKNFYFFEIQESGELPPEHRVPWRGPSYLSDRHKDRLLNYGWFDAGDHLKLMFPMGWTVATMAWSIIDGQEYMASQQYDGKSNLQWAVQTLEYGLRFLLDCSFGNGEFVAQIGVTNIDHYHVFKAEKDNSTPRTEFVTLPPNTPGSDLLYQAGAAYAAGALALRQAGGDLQLAQRAEEAARRIYSEANANPGIYSDSIPEVGLTYDNNNWEQYGFWAAAWLYRLTSDANYLADAEMYFSQPNSMGKDLWADFSWNSVYMGAAAVMLQVTGEPKYEAKMAYFAEAQLNAKGNIHHTPKGLLYLSDWGPLRYAVGGAGILGMYARTLNGQPASNGIPAEEIMAFAEHQLAYALGATGHSFVSGYGCNPPRNPHHRNACLTMEESDDQMAFDTKEFNEYELTGAIVGGPDINDNWVDDRKNFKATEVALDYNAAMLFAAVQLGR